MDGIAKREEPEKVKSLQQEGKTVEGYVLIRIDSGMIKEVYKVLKSLGGDHLLSISAVLGPYDFIVKIKAENQNSLAEYVLSYLHPINGVKETLTCVSFEPK